MFELARLSEGISFTRARTSSVNENGAGVCFGAILFSVLVVYLHG